MNNATSLPTDKVGNLSMFAALKWPMNVFSIGNRRVRESGILKPPSRYNFRMMRYWFAVASILKKQQEEQREIVVVDLGCERGITKVFAGMNDQVRWIGLDWDPQRDSPGLADYDQILDCNFDERLPLPDASADVVVCLHVFEHLPRPGATMQEIARILKPGGVFLGASPVKPLNMVADIQTERLREKIASGRRPIGKHLNAFTVRDWVGLVDFSGLRPVGVVGGHFLRWKKNPLENFPFWVRLNQIWGSCFPGWGGEVFVTARKEPREPKGHARVVVPQQLLATACALMLMAATCLGLCTAENFSVNTASCEVGRMIASHADHDQNDQFVVCETLPETLVPEVQRVSLKDPEKVRSIIQTAKKQGKATHILTDLKTLEASGVSALGRELRIVGTAVHGSRSVALLHSEPVGIPLEEVLN